MQVPGFNLFMFQIISPIGHYSPRQLLFPGDGGKQHGNKFIVVQSSYCFYCLTFVRWPYTISLEFCCHMTPSYLSVYFARCRGTALGSFILSVHSMLIYGAVIFLYWSLLPAEQKLSHCTILAPCFSQCVCVKGQVRNAPPLAHTHTHLSYLRPFCLPPYS